MSPPDAATADRRQHHEARKVFDEACALIAPFFAEENRWGNATLDHLAYRMVRDRFPALSFEEVHILVVAARRVHDGSRAAGPASGS
jgi:hypothetical protein